MPRELYQILTFEKGIVSSPDAEDIHPDAAAFAVDIDPNLSEGRLSGRYGDQILFAGSPHSPAGARSSAWLQRDANTHDLFIHDEQSNKISVVKDFYGVSPTKEVLGDATPSMKHNIVPFNREVRIGNATRVKWAGYIEEDQFELQGDTTTLHLQDAELTNPSGVPFLTKVLTDNTFTYGIAHDGTSVYVIKNSDGVLQDEITGPPFVRIRGICWSNQTATKLWVYDMDGNGLGTLYTIDTANSNAVSAGRAIADVGLTYAPIPGAQISDIVATVRSGGAEDCVYLAYHADSIDPDDVNTVGQRRYVISVDTNGSGTMNPTDRTPKLTGENANGGWIGIKYLKGTSVNDASATYHAWGTVTGEGELVAETFINSLVRVSSSRVGWTVRHVPSQKVYEDTFPPPTPEYEYAGPYYKVTAGPPHLKPALHIEYIDNTSTTASKPPICSIDTRTTDPIKINGVVWSGGDNRFVHSDSVYVTMYTVITVPVAPSSVVAGQYNYMNKFTPPLSTGDLSAATALYNDGVDKWWLVSHLSGFSSIRKATFAMDDFETMYDGGQISLALTNSGGTSFDDQRRYFYKVSFTFDGLQEGPLSRTYWYIDNLLNDKSDKSVTVRLKFPNELNRRVTAINVYRAEGELSTFSPTGFYRLVGTAATTLEVFGQVSGAYEHVLYDNKQGSGASYEARTAIAESLDNTFVNYEVSTILNGSLFIARCSHPELPDADRMVFKSKEFRFDTFNWPEQYLRLPEIPTAISSYAGRLFVFTAANVYRVNPEGMFVEEMMRGTGCFGQEALVQMPDGIFFCDTNNVYFLDGQNVHHVGNPIRRGSSVGFGWQDLLHSYWTPKAVYCNEFQQVLFMVNSASTSVYAFAFHLGKKRWDLYRFEQLNNTGDLEASGITAGKWGEVYYNDIYSFFQLSGNTSARKAFEWYTPMVDGGTATQTKKFYEVQYSGANCLVDMQSDNFSWQAVATEIPANKRINKWMQFRIYDNGVGTCRSFQVMFRKMVGLR